MTERVVREIYSKNRDRRILIVQRENGAYGYEEEYFSQDPLEMAWCRNGRHSFAICDSPETALSEARGRVLWFGAMES